MKNFAILVVVMVLMAGIFHLLFIGFDYAFHDEDEGAFTKLAEAANKSMNWEYRNRSENTSNFLKDAFGLCRVICIGLIPVAFVIRATQKPGEGE